MIRLTLRLPPVCSLLLLLTEAGGDPGIFCYRMGVGILSAGGSRFLAPAQFSATRTDGKFAQPKGNQVACSNPSSIFSAHYSTPKD